MAASKSNSNAATRRCKGYLKAVNKGKSTKKSTKKSK